MEVKADGGEGCYTMLEPVRQYALEKLEQSGKAGMVGSSHAAFFLALAEQAHPELLGERQIEWLERLELENDNLRAAMSWALSAGDYGTAARLGWALHHFWWLRGHHREGRRWMEATLEHELPPALRTRALLTAANMAYAQGDYTFAEERWGEALRLARREGDLYAEAFALGGMGLVEMARPDYEAAASSLQKSIAMLERCGEHYFAAWAYTIFGTTLLAQGEGERAERTFEEALASARRLKAAAVIRNSLYNIAQSALARGDLEKA